MSDQPSELILVMLRPIDGKLDRVIEDVQDLRHRMTSVERQLGEMRLDLAGLSARMDRMDRMERPLDIAPAE